MGMCAHILLKMKFSLSFEHNCCYENDIPRVPGLCFPVSARTLENSASTTLVGDCAFWYTYSFVLPSKICTVLSKEVVQHHECVYFIPVQLA